MKRTSWSGTIDNKFVDIINVIVCSILLSSIVSQLIFGKGTFRFGSVGSVAQVFPTAFIIISYFFRSPKKKLIWLSFWNFVNGCLSIYAATDFFIMIVRAGLLHVFIEYGWIYYEIIVFCLSIWFFYVSFRYVRMINVEGK